MTKSLKLIDRFGRHIDYVRISVTDRCDFRCVYCMAEEMTFLPRADVLSLEELYEVGAAFVRLGVSKLRITGGEPLVRRDVLKLLRQLGSLGVELVITTNGSQLPVMAQDLVDAGVQRINISLDTLRQDRFKELTRKDKFHQVIEGIEAARKAGFKRIKINTVVLKGRNDDEVLDLIEFIRARNLDISFIEEMPLGAITEHDREQSYCSSEDVRDIISTRYALEKTEEQTAGPSTYYRMADSSSRVGFISPHSHNFCGECNRVRVTVEGRLLLCLGNEHSMDLRTLLREEQDPSIRAAKLEQAIIDSMDLKPEKHHFDLAAEPQILRFMNATGG